MPYKDKEKDREQRKERNKQYRLTHKEYLREYQKKYREKNRDKIRKIGLKYYHKHKDERREIQKERNKQYKLTHKEYFKEYLKKYSAEYRKKQKLKALQAIKSTAKDILKTTNQNFINSNYSQAKKITKKEFKNQIFKQIYEILGTPEGWTRFCKLLTKQTHQQNKEE